MTLALPPLIIVIGVIAGTIVGGLLIWLVVAFLLVMTMNVGPDWLAPVGYLAVASGTIGVFFWLVSLT